MSKSWANSVWVKSAVRTLGQKISSYTVIKLWFSLFAISKAYDTRTMQLTIFEFTLVLLKILVVQWFGIFWPFNMTGAFKLTPFEVTSVCFYSFFFIFKCTFALILPLRELSYVSKLSLGLFALTMRSFVLNVTIIDFLSTKNSHFSFYNGVVNKCAFKYYTSHCNHSSLAFFLVLFKIAYVIFFLKKIINRAFTVHFVIFHSP